MPRARSFSRVVKSLLHWVRRVLGSDERAHLYRELEEARAAYDSVSEQLKQATIDIHKSDLPLTSMVCQAYECSSPAHHIREVVVCDAIRYPDKVLASPPLFSAKLALCHRHVDALLGLKPGVTESFCSGSGKSNAPLC